MGQLLPESMSHAHAHHATAPAPNTTFENTPLHVQVGHAVHSGSGGGGSILRTLFALIIVVGVIYGLTWVVRRLKGQDTSVAGPGLERVASLALGPNRSVALVRVGTEVHLLGIGEGSVTGIARFSEDEALELGLPIDVVPPGAAPAAAAPSFRDADGRPSFGATLDSLKRMTQR